MFFQDTDRKDECQGWRIHICSAPLEDAFDTECFDYLNPNYADNSMQMYKLNVNKPQYEEQFGFFLDETLFPADPDNDPIDVQIVVDAQVMHIILIFYWSERSYFIVKIMFWGETENIVNLKE